MLQLARIFLSILLIAAAVLAPLSAAAQSTFPPTAKVLVAVNPLTNKVYVVNELADTVTVLDQAAGTTRTINVGDRPQFIAVDPGLNRVYVANADNQLSITVIDGATDTNLTPTPLAVGSLGPMVVDAARGLVYIVRLTNAGFDEVTYFNGASFAANPGSGPWFSIAALMYQPPAMALNPRTQDILVPGYATGRISIIDGTYGGDGYPCGHDANATTCPNFGTGQKPFLVAVNPMVDRAVGISENAGSALWILNTTGSGSIATFALDGTSTMYQPRGLAMNTVTNTAYAIYDGRLVVVNVAAGTFQVIADTRFAGTTPVGVGVNASTNKIYVVADDGKLTVIDGATNARTPIAVAAGLSSIGVNPVTNKLYLHGTNAGPVVLDGVAGSATVPLTTTITPLANNQSGPNPTIQLQATSGFGANALAVRRVYWQLDGTNGAWTAAAGTGPFTAALTGLAPGSHTIRAFAVDGQDAPLSTGPQSAPLVGAIASYTFTVTGATATVSLASSANPSATGQSVTFTASVSGSSGTATGTVQFRAGGNAISGCSAVTLASGSAQCTTSGLGAGTHAITAHYSGGGAYDAAQSSTLTQVVNAPLPVPNVALASSANPSATGQSVTFTATVSGSAGTPAGTVAFRDGGTAISGCASVALSSGSAQCTTAALATGTHAITAHYGGSGAYQPAQSTALSQVVNTAGSLAFNPPSLAFGGQSMGTTSEPRTVTLTNTGGTAVTISNLSTLSQFSRMHDCATLAPGASCQVTLTFQPAPANVPLNGTVAVGETLQVTSNAPGSPHGLQLAGSAEKSLVSHYYQAILGRLADAEGKQFWQEEAARVAALGANVNEAWYAMAATFYTSAEYAAFNRSDTAFVTDLYRTFFNRAPDADGLAFWTGELQRGLPREVLLAEFMFSAEFRAFAQAIFGNTAARAEVDMAGDFYRGLLARLPDDGGFGYWVQRFRAAQCAGSQAVRQEAAAVSSAFVGSGEYVARNRADAQFVGDLYNAFLRRGGDVEGVSHWLQQLASGMTRQQLRERFEQSPEFGARVQAVVNQGCMS